MRKDRAHRDSAAAPSLPPPPASALQASLLFLKDLLSVFFCFLYLLFPWVPRQLPPKPTCFLIDHILQDALLFSEMPCLFKIECLTYPEKMKTLIQKDTCTPTFIHSSQDMEATQVSIDKGMDKGDTVYFYSGILLSHIKGMKYCRL